jgi:hypothetical protein
MNIVKVLKRKDASSIIIAIVLAILTSTFLSLVIGSFSAEIISGMNLGPLISEGVYGPTDSSYIASLHWSDAYLRPLLQFVLSVLMLEIITGVIVTFRSMIKKK